MDEREQSEFNSAITYLNRINGLLYQCDESALQLDSYTWFHTLIALYRELSTEMKDEEITSLEANRKRIADMINIHVNNQKTGRSKGLSPILYDELHGFEMTLRKVMRDSGLQLKLKENALNALR